MAETFFNADIRKLYEEKYTFEIPQGGISYFQFSKYSHNFEGVYKGGRFNFINLSILVPPSIPNNTNLTLLPELKFNNKKIYVSSVIEITKSLDNCYMIINLNNSFSFSFYELLVYDLVDNIQINSIKGQFNSFLPEINFNNGDIIELSFYLFYFDGVNYQKSFPTINMHPNFPDFLVSYGSLSLFR